MEGVTVGVGGGRVTTAVGVAPGGRGYGSLVGKVSVMTGVAMGGSSAAASVAVGVGSIGMGVSAEGGVTCGSIAAVTSAAGGRGMMKVSRIRRLRRAV